MSKSYFFFAFTLKATTNMCCCQTIRMSTATEEVIISLHVNAADVGSDNKFTFTFPTVHNVALMRINNVEVNPTIDGATPDYVFMQILEGGYTSHSAIFDKDAAEKIETNIVLKINLPSSSVPSSWNSTGIIKTGRSALRTSSIGKSIDRITIRLLKQDLTSYTDDSLSFDLTLMSANSA